MRAVYPRLHGKVGPSHPVPLSQAVLSIPQLRPPSLFYDQTSENNLKTWATTSCAARPFLSDKAPKPTQSHKDHKEDQVE
jgi:hypothetical protein